MSTLSASYVAVETTLAGSIQTGGAVRRVTSRADAVELHHDDAVLLQQRAQELWPDLDWAIDKTYSGKYVVRAQLEP